MKKYLGFVCLLFTALTLLVACNQTEKHTVTFNTNGGSEIAAVQIEDGECLTKPENPTKQGYDFVRWNYDFAEYSFDTPVTEDITLDAVWAPSDNTSYTVKVFAETDGGAYEERSAEFSDILSGLTATTDSTVDVSDLANEILTELNGYYFDRTKEECVYSGVISGNGSTVFNLYFSKLELSDGVLIGFSNPIVPYVHEFSCEIDSEVLVESEYLRPEDSSVLKVTATSNSRRIIFEIEPEIKDFSGYDYIGFWVYNGTNADLYYRNGLFWEGLTDANSGGFLGASCAIYRNEWNFVTVDLTKDNVGEVLNALPVENVENFAIALERNNAGSEIMQGSVVYISNVRGYHFENDHSAEENVIVRFDETTGRNAVSGVTESAINYWKASVEDLTIDTESVTMTKISVNIAAERDAQHIMTISGCSSNTTIYSGYSFDIYNNNDYAIKLLGEEIVPKTLQKIIVNKRNTDAFSDDGRRMELLVKKADGSYLDAGSSFYLGNICGVPKSSETAEYTVKVYQENDSGTYDDVTAQFSEYFADSSESVGEVVDLRSAAVQYCPEGYFPDAKQPDALFSKEVESTESFEMRIYYSKITWGEEDLVYASNGSVELDYFTTYGDETYSYKMNAGTADCRIYIKDAAKEEIPENATNVVFYIYHEYGSAINFQYCSASPWSATDKASLASNTWTKVTLSVEEFKDMDEQGAAYFVRAQLWSSCDYYVSGLYFE